MPNQPFPLSNKICRGVQWRPPLHAPSLSYPSFHSASYVCFCLFLSLFLVIVLSLYAMSLCLSLAGLVLPLSRNSHIPTRKSLVDLFAACNWPISLKPLDREELPNSGQPLANLFMYLTLLLCPNFNSHIHYARPNNISL